MHFHQKSTNQLSNGIKAFMLILITYTTWCDASLSPEDIAEAISLTSLELKTEGKYCGKRLTEAMKTYCIPSIRDAILRSDDGSPKTKKSSN